MENMDLGLTSIAALHQTNGLSSLGEWKERFGGEIVVLLDGQERVWFQYKSAKNVPNMWSLIER